MRIAPFRGQFLFFRLALLAAVLTLACCAPAQSETVPSDPLGATPHRGSTTFRVWAPFVEKVSVRINAGTPAPMVQEPGHPDPADTVWTATVPGARPGDRYTYSIQTASTAREYVDPRALQLTPDHTASIIVDRAFPQPLFKPPPFNEMVIYELHVGSFNSAAQDSAYTFHGVREKLDYLAGLGVNAIELMPIHANIITSNHHPADYNWGYDPVQLFAVNSSYGTPAELAELVAECHRRQIAVILDVVYNHLNADNLLQRFGGVALPAAKDGIYFYGDNRENSGFGPRPDYGRPQVRRYLEDDALMWLRTFGMDGLRWDSTMNIRAYSGRFPLAEGEELLRRTNSDFRTTVPGGPGKLSIAEDLRNNPDVVRPISEHGFGFNSQWDDDFCVAVRNAVTAVADEQRDLHAIAGVLTRKYRDQDVFTRVVYSENHDQVGHPQRGERRLPPLIDSANPESVFAKKRSALAAALALTAPGIPMLFQGQEMLENRDFSFANATPVDWTRATRLSGIVRVFHDLIRLRRNLHHQTAGLTQQNINVFHVDDGTRTLAYDRYGSGGAGDDVVVVVNLANRAYHDLRIGFPRGGKWSVRFNSGAAGYDPSFIDGDSFDTVATPEPRDNLKFSGPIGIGPYSVVILSQDPG